MRYEIDQVLPVVFLERPAPTHDKPGCHLLFTPYSSMYDPEQPEIRVQFLTVKEQHDVAWEFDPKGEKRHTGYILADAEGNAWRNQYPYASYGQTTDTADGLFDLALNSKEAVDEFLITHPYGSAEGILATRYLDNLDRVLRGLAQNQVVAENQAALKSTQEHYDRVVAALNDADLTVERNPVVFKGETIEGMFQHKVSAVVDEA